MDFSSPKHERDFLDLVLEEVHTFEREAEPSRVLLFPPVSSRLRFLTHRAVEDWPQLCSFSVGENVFRRVAVCFCHIRAEVKEDSDSENSSFYRQIKERDSQKPKPNAKSRTPKRPDQPLYLPRAARERLPDRRATAEGLTDRRATGEGLTDRRATAEGLTDRRATGEGLTDRRATGEGLTDRRATGEGLTDRRATAEGLTDRSASGEGLTDRRATGEGLTDRRATGEGLTDRRATAEGLTDRSASGEGLTDRRATAEGLTDRSASGEGLTDRSASGEGLTDRSASGEGLTDRSASGEGLTDRSASGEGLTDRSASGEGLTDRSASGEGLTDHSRDSDAVSQSLEENAEETEESSLTDAAEERRTLCSSEKAQEVNRAEEEVWDDEVWTNAVTLEMTESEGDSTFSDSAAAEQYDSENTGADAETEELTEELTEEIRPHLKEGLSFGVFWAHSDFSSFESLSVNCDDFRHVIEIYDFPAHFRTQDLLDAFAEYREGGMKVKWVDDTHALGVFSCEAAALQALSMSHPLLKTRALSQGSKKSKSKALRRAEFLQPVKERPRTDCAVARRMVTRALGLRSLRY